MMAPPFPWLSIGACVGPYWFSVDVDDELGDGRWPGSRGLPRGQGAVVYRVEMYPDGDTSREPFNSVRVNREDWLAMMTAAKAEDACRLQEAHGSGVARKQADHPMTNRDLATRLACDLFRQRLGPRRIAVDIDERRRLFDELASDCAFDAAQIVRRVAHHMDRGEDDDEELAAPRARAWRYDDDG